METVAEVQSRGYPVMDDIFRTTACKTMSDLSNSVEQKCVAKILKARIEKNEERIDKQEGEIHDLRVDLAMKEKEIKTLKSSVEKMESRMAACQTRADDLEQYSRRNNVRVFGVPEAPDEDTDDQVIKIVSNHLGYNLTKAEIDRSHRSGKPRSPNSKPRPILVKLCSHRSKFALLKNRRKMKDSGFSIQEDLTRANHEILMKLVKHPKVAAAWSADGRVIAALKTSQDGVQVKKVFTSLQQVTAL
nr:protein unc-13 homolog C-like [Lytechinus pictus]